jgi:hypothetical protein
LSLPPNGIPTLRIDNKTQELADFEDPFTYATVSFATEGIEYKDQKIIIYQDRVFWPATRNDFLCEQFWP